MKILFLDFDGVLNSLDWYKRRAELGMTPPQDSFLHRSHYELDETKVKMISDFVKDTGVTVVVSSSWRILHSLQELRDIVKACGWDASEFLDITPRSEKGFRGDEINAWLNDSSKRHVEILEPITHYVIFDDDGDFYPDQLLVKTSWEHGLIEDHLNKAREILTK